MGGASGRTITIFSRPFTLPGFDEILPAGEYGLETELAAPSDHLRPENWRASVLVHLHPRMSHPGLRRTLTVSLADLEEAIARDKLPAHELAQLVLEELLTDPMIRLVMEADGVTDAELRASYEGFQWAADHAAPTDATAVQIAENEGMPPRSNYFPQSGGPRQRPGDDGVQPGSRNPPR